MLTVFGDPASSVVNPALAEAAGAWRRRAGRGRGLAKAATAAIGDGADDLDMVCAAGTGVVYRDKPVLYLQGYRRGEFMK